MNYLIIGNSCAGTNCAAEIRNIDKKGNITILSEENFPAYGRPLISYFLQGKQTLETIKYKKEDFYTKNKITVKLNSKVESVNTINVHPKTKRVGRYAGKTNKVKKAIVKLKEGSSLEL